MRITHVSVLKLLEQGMLMEATQKMLVSIISISSSSN